MYSSIFTSILDRTCWEKVNEAIREKDFSGYDECYLKESTYEMYFSWAGVAVITSTPISDGILGLKKDSILMELIKAEAYIQSRWFIGDNSMDNVTKSVDYSLEKLQRIESLVEFYNAELENEISANMKTLYKEILERVIDTSEVRKLYKSVVSRIQTQRKIREAHNQDRKNRNRLYANCFLAIFTATSLYDTVCNWITKQYDFKTIALFLLMLFISVGTVVWEYRNKGA